MQTYFYLHEGFDWILEGGREAIACSLWWIEERIQGQGAGGGGKPWPVTGGMKGHPYLWHSHLLSHHTWKPLDAPPGRRREKPWEGQRCDQPNSLYNNAMHQAWPSGVHKSGVVSTESEGPCRAHVPHAAGHLRSLGQHLLSEKQPRTRHLNLSTGQTAVHDAGKTPPVRDW